jgi:GcrA cell cycle regulator
MEWNEERIEALTRMWREGLSASQVARQLGGVTRSAVIGKVHRLGISGREPPTRPNALGGRPSNRIRATASPGGVRRVPAARVAGPGAPRAQPRAPFEVAATASIHTLTSHACRWPIGDPDQDGFGFCGRLRSGHGSYCAGHAPMAVRRRDSGFPSREIERIVTRFVEAPAADKAEPGIAWREIA